MCTRRYTITYSRHFKHIHVHVQSLCLHSNHFHQSSQDFLLPDDDVASTGTGPHLQVALSSVDRQKVKEGLEGVLGDKEPHGDGPRLHPP